MKLIKENKIVYKIKKPVNSYKYLFTGFFIPLFSVISISQSKINFKTCNLKKIPYNKVTLYRNFV